MSIEQPWESWFSGSRATVFTTVVMRMSKSEGPGPLVMPVRLGGEDCEGMSLSLWSCREGNLVVWRGWARPWGFCAGRAATDSGEESGYHLLGPLHSVGSGRLKHGSSQDLEVNLSRGLKSRESKSTNVTLISKILKRLDYQGWFIRYFTMPGTVLSNV